jgi:phospholipid/cholesterol/gamma-HCH transport system permease protein
MFDMPTLNVTKSDKALELALSGRLAVDNLGSVWQKAMSALKQYKGKAIAVDAADLTSCDSAGISLLLELKQRCQDKHWSLTGLAPKYQAMFDRIASIELKEIVPPADLSFVHHVGHVTVNVIDTLRLNVAYMGELITLIVKSFLHPRRLRWRDLTYAIEQCGPNSLVIVALLGFIIGLIVSFQSAIPLAKFGGKIYIPAMVGIGLTREMGPLLVAIILGGRTASSFAAELGTMKVNQEIDALTTMGLSPMRYLVLPRVLAVMLMAPLMNLFFILFGLFGSLLFMSSIGYGPAIFFSKLDSAVSIGTLFGGLLKVTVFGVFIGGIGCMHGLRTKFGASSVGASTTRAVVSCIIMTVLLDGLFAVVFYALGW